MTTLKEGTYKGVLTQGSAKYEELFVIKSISGGRVTGEASFSGGAAAFTGTCSNGSFSFTSNAVLWGSIELSIYSGSIANDSLTGTWRSINNSHLSYMQGGISLKLVPSSVKTTVPPTSPSPASTKKSLLQELNAVEASKLQVLSFLQLEQNIDQIEAVLISYRKYEHDFFFLKAKSKTGKYYTVTDLTPYGYKGPADAFNKTGAKLAKLGLLMEDKNVQSSAYSYEAFELYSRNKMTL